MTVLTTQRLRLEPLDNAHLTDLQAMNSDPVVMRYILGRPQNLDDTLAMVQRVKERWYMFGFSWWGFVEVATGELIGAGCIQHLERNPGNPLEIGWRLRTDRWRHGFAFEAADRMARFAFETLDVPLLCAVCHTENIASASLMKKLGMRYRGTERRYEMMCAAYEITQMEWKSRATCTADRTPRAPE
jgi:ribosomal-protein-alanine N-acetyltransferase